MSGYRGLWGKGSYEVDRAVYWRPEIVFEHQCLTQRKNHSVLVTMSLDDDGNNGDHGDDDAKVVIMFMVLMFTRYETAH